MGQRAAGPCGDCSYSGGRCLADASGLPEGPARGGAALAGLPVSTHREDRGRL